MATEIERERKLGHTLPETVEERLALASFLGKGQDESRLPASAFCAADRGSFESWSALLIDRLDEVIAWEPSPSSKSPPPEIR